MNTVARTIQHSHKHTWVSTWKHHALKIIMESIALNYKYVYPFIQFWYCFEIYNRYITEKRILEISGQGGQNNLSAKGSGMWVVTCNSCLQVTTGSRRMWKHPLKLQWKYISNLEFPRSKSLMPRSAGRYFQVASRLVRAECAETVLHAQNTIKRRSRQV